MPSWSFFCQFLRNNVERRNWKDQLTCFLLLNRYPRVGEATDTTTPKYKKESQVGTSSKLRTVHTSEKNVHMAYVRKNAHGVSLKLSLHSVEKCPDPTYTVHTNNLHIQCADIHYLPDQTHPLSNQYKSDIFQP